MTTWRLSLCLERPRAEAAAGAFERAFAAEAPPLSLYETRQDGPWAVELLLEADAPEPLRARAAAALADAGAADAIEITALDERDWVSEGLKSLVPVRAGRFVLHGSHSRHRVVPSRWRIEIEAARAFGTGHHATTAGCLLAIDRLARQRRPDRVLDVGTGSGVLAIAALKAGARRAIGTDIDAVAVATARENAALAGVLPRLRLHVADGVRHRALRAAGPFDLVLANILARPLVALAPALAPLVAWRGVLVVSGLRTVDARRVLAAYRARGLVPVWRRTIEDWPTLVLARGSGRPKRKRPARTPAVYRW